MISRRHSEERRTVDAIIDALDDAGVRHVIGMPGGNTLRLWSALNGHQGIRSVLVREESLGSYAAEAYGRLTGTPMVVMGQGEWIVGNAGQAYMEALLGSCPMVILTEMSDGGVFSHHAPYQSGTGDYGTWDARKSLEAVTKRVMVSTSPAQAVQHTQLALKHALSGEPGPVAIVFHSDALRGSVGPAARPQIYPSFAYLPRRNNAIDESLVDQVETVLSVAERPVVIAGNGIRVGQACGSLARFAEALDLAVVTTAGGKGVFDEYDPRAAGVIGPFGWTSANQIVGDADVVVAIGTKLASSDTLEGNPALIDPERQIIIQIEIEPVNASWTLPVDHVMIGEAAVQMDAIARRFSSAPTRERTAAERVAACGTRVPAPRGDTLPMSAQRVVELAAAAVPRDTVVTCDAGENRLFMMQWFRSAGRGRYLQPAAGGGMGHAVPAALGAKLARPDLPALAVCGDGGFSMVLPGLMSAVEESLPIAVLVLNNNALGWVLHGTGKRPAPSTFDAFDLAAIARSLHCDGIRTTTEDELTIALAGIGELTRPLVIEVPTSLDVSFKDVLQHLDSRRAESGGY